MQVRSWSAGVKRGWTVKGHTATSTRERVRVRFPSAAGPCSILSFFVHPKKCWQPAKVTGQSP
jgi:hypothetical protein